MSLTLTLGDLAPDFTLWDGEGRLFSLHQFKGQQVILYFYPRDQSPGCTKQALGFRDAYAHYQTHHIQILGISTDSSRSHQKFATKLNLPFPLLADEEALVSKAYGVYGPKKMMGREYEGITRTSFVISSEGTVVRIYKKIKVETHAEDILKDLEIP